MEPKRLSVCIIAKNEADNIERCISSLAGASDEIIVVDTGSRDGTPDVAKSLGAKVILAGWEDDFSKARNLSLEQAQGDWILVMDCDEELHPDSRSELKQLLELEGAEAYFLQIVNTTAEGMELIVPGLRLFRNKKEYRFMGRIHEQILGVIGEQCEPNQILQTGVLILHHGYDRNRADIPAKIQRNMKILEGIPEDRRDGFYYYNLGTEYLRTGQKEAALAQFMKAAPLTHPGQGYGPIMVKRIITLLLGLGKYRQAINNLEHYQKIYPDYTDLTLMQGVCHYICGRYTAAVNAIKQYLDRPPAPSWYPLEKCFLNQSPQALLTAARQRSITTEHPPLSVCITGHNEAFNLARCIKSVNELAFQVIYVDTGSQDSSLEIASELGAETYSMVWHHNFARIRNHGLEQVMGDWVLVLNADEVLEEKSIRVVVRAIKNGTRRACMARIHTPLDAGQSPLNSQIAGSMRLFPREVRYVGIMAEEYALTGVDDGSAQPLDDFEIRHMHFQFPPQQVAQKIKNWEDIIMHMYPEVNPTRQFMLGREAFYAQEPHKAVPFLRESLQMESPDKISAYYYLTVSLTNTGEYESAIETADEGIVSFPDYTDLYYLKAMAHAIAGHFEEAEALLLQCLEMGDSAWWKYLGSPGTGSFKALLSLGAIYARQGKFQEAVNSFIEATTIPECSEQAVEHLTALQAAADFQIQNLLEERGLLGWKNILIVAQTYTKMGKRLESWEFLKLLDPHEVDDRQEYLNRIIKLTETHLFNIKRQVAKYIPDHPLARYV